ncbi:phosphonate C-P lyase system protein PhnL [Jannaschia sp. LMIT008]|uniref:phosphonate C-P lyase system protein PhnL n=1 Tax=Jannaschia maritima TaxID=3032585 RepID=UPI0028122B01|nr:phosphonate C-P lyase system protein PhnL [Jannaschia sp. LMIT008]
MSAAIEVRGLSKAFVLHNQGAARINVLERADLTVAPGECIALTGSSGSGKSTLLRMLAGNYLGLDGSIRIAGTEIVGAPPRTVSGLRRSTLGHVSQFLRVVPRVPARDVVAEPLRMQGADPAEARATAEAMLARLNLPERLWGLSPTTFSGGEQQRVNVARGFVHRYRVLLLDEPTASLDPVNRDVVLSLIEEAKARGAAVVGIFHDAEARARVCDREVDVSAMTP